MRRPVRTFNKHVLNPLIRTFAGRSPTPFAVVHHVGRRSGKTYETPIIVMRIEGGFVIELTYGPEVDWYKNVLAAGRCTILWHNRDYAIEKIEPLDAESGLAAFRFPFRPILRLLGKRDFARMMEQT
jgi:deazaflavin-dependent oxidoreductase (nitroreductase family)